MKTRIVYPQLWLDEKFYACSLETKVLFNYLINNIYLGLSRYVRIAERKIGFDTGLNSDQIALGKKELEALGWCIFKGEWIFHKHNCAYTDYVRNDRVAESKEKEINAVPDEILEYFNSFCLNGDRTLLQLKSEIRNKKPETRNSSNKPLSVFNTLSCGVTADEVADSFEEYQKTKGGNHD